MEFDVGPRQSGSGLAALAARLTRRLADANADSNLVFSPLSIYAALALVAVGARGDTLDEILRVLGARSSDELAEFVSSMAETALVDRSESGGPRVAFACGVWSDATRPLKPAYREAVVGTCKAEAKAVDFKNKAEEAREQINAWAAQVTRNLIDSILSPGSVRPDTAVVVGNAIYFKGKWNSPFQERNTKRKLFYRLDRHVVIDVPYMQSFDRQCVAVHDGFKVLRLWYKTEPYQFDREKNNFTRYSMCVFLPDAYDGLWSLVDKITSRPSFLYEHLPKSPVQVGEFRVPKFKLSFSSSVTAVLQQLGLRLPFSPEADLSDMVDNGSGLPLVVEDVFHKAVIEVNEEGTEAAAVTMARTAVGRARMPRQLPPPVDFIADHPFAYFILEEVSVQSSSWDMSLTLR